MQYEIFQYQMLKEKISLEIKTISMSCITSDIWSSNSQFSYLSATLHYINNDWELCSRVLGLYYLDQQHSSEYLFKKTNDILSEWKLPEQKILFFIADSGANIKAAFELFDKYLPCSAHKINSAVDDLFKIKNIKIYENAYGINFFL